MEKQFSNLQTMVQGAQILLAENSKEVTEINRRLSKKEKKLWGKFYNKNQ
jgi:hypothetical protein